ncbi:hypothetical protein [Actinoplanes utahensis]|uniref:hypothetical protein n=1 Tax=Actinoplanes utahensis TaxID=1869 RepID=UPI000691311D|nr:hypothetical protein [Actinoplanes utahensis]GIF27044.1 hypothetical protein Aut01nite_00300 [Actinoplanes utahensis]
MGSDENGLRVGRYVDHRTAKPETGPPGVTLPNIADYWPDAPHRRLQDGAAWQAFLPLSAFHSDTDAGRPTDVPPERRWLQRPVVLTGMTAMLVVAGTVLLARPLADSEIRQQAAATPPPPPATIPLEPAPSSSPAPLPPPPSVVTPSPPPTTPPRKAVRSARFEFVSGVTELTVRIAGTGDAPFRVAAPLDAAAATFGDGVLRVDVNRAGSAPSTLEVLLSDRITWHLRIGAGVRTLNLDTTSGAISRIDLDGGAETTNLSLGRPSGVLPIRMTGGVSIWRIRTTSRIPARVTIGDGAGNVTLYGDSSGGKGPGSVVESGSLGFGPGLAIDASGGLGSLEVTSRR